VIPIADISAVIVTYGLTDLSRILATLPYPEVIVWNDQERGSQGCYGRYLAAMEATRPVVYFQDDDVIFTAHEGLGFMYQPGRITANMPSPWYETCGYDKLKQALVGAGSLVDRDLPWLALERYLSEFPKDDLFLDYCDVVVGMLTPYLRVDLGYEVLPFASAPGRIYTTPGAPARKREMQARVMGMRDGWARCVEMKSCPAFKHLSTCPQHPDWNR
jgi:hypothetical protein